MVPSSLNSDIYQTGYKLMDHKAEKHEAKGGRPAGLLLLLL